MTLTFDLWPWTLVVYRLCRGQTLYQIWAKSGNPRPSYEFNIWRNDLEHVSRVALGSGIICTEFELRQLVCAWIIALLDADTLSYAVTLTFDPLTLNIYITSSVTWSKSVRNLSKIEQSPAELLIIYLIFAPVMSRSDLDPWPLDLELLGCYVCSTLHNIWAKSNDSRLSYWRFSTFSPYNFIEVGQFLRTFSGVRGPNFTKLVRDIGSSSSLAEFVSELRYLAAFSNTGGSNSSDVENKAKFCTICPP